MSVRLMGREKKRAKPRRLTLNVSTGSFNITAVCLKNSRTGTSRPKAASLEANAAEEAEEAEEAFLPVETAETLPSGALGTAGFPARSLLPGLS